jgi:hypothetical protein
VPALVFPLYALGVSRRAAAEREPADPDAFRFEDESGASFEPVGEGGEVGGRALLAVQGAVRAPADDVAALIAKRPIARNGERPSVEPELVGEGAGRGVLVVADTC